MSETELKQNLIRFINYTMFERCDNVVHDVIDDAIIKGQGEFQSTCKVISDKSKKQHEKYQITIRIEKI